MINKHLPMLCYHSFWISSGLALLFLVLDQATTLYFPIGVILIIWLIPVGVYLGWLASRFISGRIKRG